MPQGNSQRRSVAPYSRDLGRRLALAGARDAIRAFRDLADNPTESHIAEEVLRQLDALAPAAGPAQPDLFA